MANVTLKLDDDLVRRARIRALEQGTSMNAVIRRFLEEFTGGDVRAQGLRRFLDLAGETRTGSGPEGRAWSRDDLYER
ncbi:FitA-like ribbon-helix-helix domain-containing protein [Jiangella anatolica]|uniref:Toxin-antitoxin system HicB family antitoxin n=1 Tax=Jiangella anatolica TaxID=2670374 RepID=A0A2W2BDN7_9ACTN|nr:toxin-antitoxin system HicB family antitoxin [Jiangella anatolica]PZF83430.1 toxin-antitoxin system HicB family antitoxin [Jiangella anatolica]